MKKTFLLLILLGLIPLPFSCDGNGSQCPGIFVNNISELETNFGYLQPIFLNFTLRDSTTYDSASFQVVIANVEEVSTASVFTGLTPSVFAESCPLESRLSHQLESIEITSTSEITIGSTVYNPGDNINDLFLVTLDNYGTPQPSSVEDFILALSEDSEYFSNIGGQVYFQFNIQPAERINGTFSFLFRFSDRDIDAVSEPVIIYPN